MTKLMTIVIFGILAFSLCSTGSVLLPNRSISHTFRPVSGVSSPSVPGARAHRTPSRRSKAAVSRARARADEAGVVILYGSRPWSWM
jgi:hypothetical protein